MGGATTHVEAARVAQRRLVGVVPAGPGGPDAARGGVGRDDVAGGDHRVRRRVAGHDDAVLGLDPHHPAHGHASTILTACAATAGCPPSWRWCRSCGDRLGPPVEELDFDGIQRARAATLRRNRVTDLVTGGVDRAVGITYGTAPARDEHEIPLRIYRPRALRDARTDVPVVMWFHGGGWVLGNVVGYDPICTFIAAEVGCVVVSVDYRMAPEHRAPVAVAGLRRRHDLGRRQRRRAAGRHLADGGGRRLGRRQPRGRRGPGAARPRRHPAAPPGADLPRDRPDDGVAVDRASTRTPPSSPSARWTPSATTTCRPGTTCATRCSHRCSAGSTGCRRPWCRPRTSTRSATTASGTPPRCAMPGCPPGSRTTSRCPTASPSCRARPRPWGASSGGSWPASSPPRSAPGDRG